MMRVAEIPPSHRRFLWATLILGGLSTSLAGCSGDAAEDAARSAESRAASSFAALPTTAMRFADRTAVCGINFSYRDGQEAGYFTFLETLGGGAAACDYDRDGDVDLIVAGGGAFGTNHEIFGLPPACFRNEGDWRFTAVAASAGLTVAPCYSHGITSGDCNNDGFPDLVVTGYGGLTLYFNHGDGTFALQDSSRTGLDDDLWSSSAGWGDLDGDGNLDLVVAHYVDWSFDKNFECLGPDRQHRDLCNPDLFQSLPNTFYLSNGDGTFRQIPRQGDFEKVCKGLGVLIADVDLDGKVDVYIASDGTPKLLYRNLGGGRFAEVGRSSGCAVNETGDADGSMGLDLLDYDLDGLPDLWVTNFEDQTFAIYRNLGECLFRQTSRSAGIAAVGGLYVGWGTAAVDFDRDGDEDLFATNGHALRFPTRAPVEQAPLLFENLGNGRFVNVAASAGSALTTSCLGRGLAAADLDDDGDVDLLLVPINEPIQILSNESAPGSNWLGLDLIGTVSNRDAVGTLVRIETLAGVQMRQIKGGGSYASTSDRRIYFGLGKTATITRLEIRWPAGQIQTLENPAVNRIFKIREPR